MAGLATTYQVVELIGTKGVSGVKKERVLSLLLQNFLNIDIVLSERIY